MKQNSRYDLSRRIREFSCTLKQSLSGVRWLLFNYVKPALRLWLAHLVHDVRLQQAIEHSSLPHLGVESRRSQREHSRTVIVLKQRETT
jgi:hypothetical protein